MKTFKKSNRHLTKKFKIKSKTSDAHAIKDKTEDKIQLTLFSRTQSIKCNLLQKLRRRSSMSMQKSATKNHSIAHLYDKILTKRIFNFLKVRKLLNKENYSLFVTRQILTPKTNVVSMLQNLCNRRKLQDSIQLIKLKKQVITHFHLVFLAFKNSLKCTNINCKTSPDV